MRAKFYLPRSSFLSENQQIHERVWGVKGWNKQSKANEGERKTKRDTVRPGISWLSVDKQVISIQYSQPSKCSKRNNNSLNILAVLHQQKGTQTHRSTYIRDHIVHLHTDMFRDRVTCHTHWCPPRKPSQDLQPCSAFQMHSGPGHCPPGEMLI